MKRKALFSATPLLALALATLAPPTQAATATMSAGTAVNGLGQVKLVETITCTLTDGSSVWDTSEFHANGIQGNTNRFTDYNVGVYTDSNPGFRGPGSHDQTDLLPISGYAPQGTYRCWGIAHGHRDNTFPYTTWDVATNEKTVKTPS